MSGQKDIRIEAIDPLVLAERARRMAEVARQKAEADAAAARAAAEAEAARRKVEAANAARRRLGDESSKLGAELESLAIERRQLARRLDGLKKDALASAREAADLGGAIAGDRASAEARLGELGELTKRLTGELASAERLLSAHDGGEATQAAEALAKATEEHAQRLAETATLGAELAAFASNATLGVVLHELLSASADLGYTVTRAFSSGNEVELLITNEQKETIRIAANLSENREREALTDDEHLKLVLEGRHHESREACLTDTVVLLERLRERGVQVSVRAGGGSPRHLGREASVGAAQARERG